MEQPNTNHVITVESGLASLIQEREHNTEPSTVLFIVKNKERIPAVAKESDLFSCTVIENFYEAIFRLKNPSKNQPLPEAILGYCGKDYMTEVERFGSALLQDEKLSPIPFILIRDEPPPVDVNEARAIPGVDDLVRSTITAEEIDIKIKLIKKLKQLKIDKRGELPFLENEDSLSTKYIAGSFFKRCLDVVVSLLLLCCALPFMLLIALIIKLESKGPVFYTAYRSGSNYRIFKFIKFRSMVVNADKELAALSGNNQYGDSKAKEGVFYKISNDPRTTKFGKFLRNTSLDELPQLINVLKGDMSLVGNRPLPLYEAKTLTTDRYVQRFDAPAGITGLWQVKKRGQKEMSAEERIKLDIIYARKHSFLLDMKIMLGTPKALTQKDNV